MGDAEKHCFLIELTVALRSVPAATLPVVPRAVLRVLGDHRNAESGLSWPKVETIAREAGCSESTARVALAQLLKAGWIAVVTPATPRNSARYDVRTTGAAIVVEPAKAPRVPVTGTQGAGSEHSGCREPAPSVPGASTQGAGSHTRSSQEVPIHLPKETSQEGAASRPLPPVGKTASLFDAPEVKPERAAPKRRIPDGWTPKPRHETLALSSGLPTGHVKIAAERFKGHHGAKGTTFANWDQAFDNWIRNDAERAKGSGPGVRGASPGGMRRPVNNRQDTGWATIVPDEAADDAIENMIRGGGATQHRAAAPGN